MKVRFNQLPLFLLLSLTAGLTGGCGLFGGGEDAAVNQSPQPTDSQPFPSPEVPIASAPSKIALTRPTNPDDRIRVIKSGRNDPFALLVPPSRGDSPAAPNTPADSGNNAPNSGRDGSAQDNQRGGNAGGDSASRPAVTRLPDLPGPGQPLDGSGLPGGVNLPALPPKPELAGVKVTGVVVVAGVPSAIIQAPGEPTSRTVSVGDSISNGQLYVKAIDTSNRAEPVVIFQQGGLEFSVAVGRDPVLLASASSASSPIRGLYSVRGR